MQEATFDGKGDDRKPPPFLLCRDHEKLGFALGAFEHVMNQWRNSKWSSAKKLFHSAPASGKVKLPGRKHGFRVYMDAPKLGTEVSLEFKRTEWDYGLFG